MYKPTFFYAIPIMHLKTWQRPSSPSPGNSITTTRFMNCYWPILRQRLYLRVLATRYVTTTNNNDINVNLTTTSKNKNEKEKDKNNETERILCFFLRGFKVISSLQISALDVTLIPVFFSFLSPNRCLLLNVYVRNFLFVNECICSSLLYCIVIIVSNYLVSHTGNVFRYCFFISLNY